MEEIAKVRTGFLYVYNTCILLQWKPDEYYIGMELNLSLYTRHDQNSFIIALFQLGIWELRLRKGEITQKGWGKNGSNTEQ